jgi:hypothetical protein
MRRVNAMMQVIKGGGDHGEKEVHFQAALHPAILRAKEEVIPHPRRFHPSRAHRQPPSCSPMPHQVVEPMFEDIVIDQQSLLDSPATWGKVLELVPDANQRVWTLVWFRFDPL